VAPRMRIYDQKTTARTKKNVPTDHPCLWRFVEDSETAECPRLFEAVFGVVAVISSSESSSGTGEPGTGESGDSGATDGARSGRVMIGRPGLRGGAADGRAGIVPIAVFRSKPSKFRAVCWIRFWRALSSTCKAWMFCNACTTVTSCPFVLSHSDMNRSDDHSRRERFSASSRATLCPNSSILSRSARRPDSYSASRSTMVEGICEAEGDLEKKKNKNKKKRTTVLPRLPSRNCNRLLSSSSRFFAANGPLGLILRRRS
jgi:hypothetical protein